MIKILLIDDDFRHSELLKNYLSRYGMKLDCISDAEKGLKRFELSDPDLLLLDIMLPGMNGFDVCTEIRKTSNVPIIMLTARGDVYDRISGLELGADDYIGKPFEPRELLARMHSILRRVQDPSSMIDTLEFDGLMIDKMKQELYLDKEIIHLSTTEFEALVLIADHAGQSLDREFLVENLRGIQWQSFDRSIDVLVSRLRNKLGETPEKTRFIKTVHGVGYIFIATRINNV